MKGKFLKRLLQVAVILTLISIGFYCYILSEFHETTLDVAKGVKNILVDIEENHGGVDSLKNMLVNTVDSISINNYEE